MTSSAAQQRKLLLLQKDSIHPLPALFNCKNLILSVIDDTRCCFSLKCFQIFLHGGGIFVCQSGGKRKTFPSKSLYRVDIDIVGIKQHQNSIGFHGIALVTQSLHISILHLLAPKIHISITAKVHHYLHHLHDKHDFNLHLHLHLHPALQIFISATRCCQAAGLLGAISQDDKHQPLAPPTLWTGKPNIPTNTLLTRHFQRNEISVLLKLGISFSLITFSN